MSAHEVPTFNDPPELQAAVTFWATIVPRCVKNASQFQGELFRGELYTGLKRRIEGHWYLDEPSRGQGYRALVCAESVDRLLIAASKKSLMFVDFRKFFPIGLVMYIDPGNVSVKYFTQKGKSEKIVTIYPPPCDSDASEGDKFANAATVANEILYMNAMDARENAQLMKSGEHTYPHGRRDSMGNNQVVYLENINPNHPAFRRNSLSSTNHPFYPDTPNPYAYGNFRRNSLSAHPPMHQYGNGHMKFSGEFPRRSLSKSLGFPNDDGVWNSEKFHVDLSMRRNSLSQQFPGDAAF